MKKMSKGMALMAVMLAMMLALTGCGVSITDITVPDVVQVAVGETATVDITYVDAKNTDQATLAEAAAKAGVIWEMADTAIATVDGMSVTGVAAGETTLTIKMGDISKTVAVQVVVPVEGVEAPETLALAINGEDSKPLGAKLVPEGATGAKLAYKSSDEAVATVNDNGVVTAVADGECVITTTVVAVDAESALTAETKVTVTTAPAAITLAQSEGILYVGGSTTLEVYTTPEEAAAPDPEDITYVSADDKVATVDEDGKVTAKAVGQTTITVTYQGLTAEYKLVVKAKSAGGNTGTKPSTGGGSTTGTGGGSTGGTTPSTGGGGGGVAPAPDPAPAPAPEPAPPTVPDGANPDDHHTSPDMNTDGAGDTGDLGGLFDD